MPRRPHEDENAAWEQDADWWKRGPQPDRDDLRGADDSDDDDADPEDDLVACPHCRKMIHGESVRCPECGEYLEDGTRSERKPWWVVMGLAWTLFIMLGAYVVIALGLLR